MGLSLITFSAGTVIKSADVNSNFNAINTELFDISQANFNPATQLPDTLLATISTSGKVNGSALVSQTIDAVKGQYVWFLDGTIATGVNLSVEFEVGAVLTIVGAKARIKTGNTGAAMLIDINKNGATIFGTRLTIADGAVVDDNNHTFVITALAANDVVTIDIDQVGSTIPGSDLTVTLELEQKIPQ